MIRTNNIPHRLVRTIRKEQKELSTNDTNDISGIERQYTLKELKKLLNIRQMAFCCEYIKNGWNATQAYRKAYPEAEYNSAMSRGSSLLRNVKIQQYIQHIREDFEMLCGISKANQIAEYRKIAFSSLRYIHNTWITRKEWEDIEHENSDQLDAIESIETKVIHQLDIYKTPVEVEYVKVKMHPKIAALKEIDNLMGYSKPQKIEMDTRVTNNLDLSRYTAEEKAMLIRLARKNEYTE